MNKKLSQILKEIGRGAIITAALVTAGDKIHEMYRTNLPPHIIIERTYIDKNKDGLYDLMRKRAIQYNSGGNTERVLWENERELPKGVTKEKIKKQVGEGAMGHEYIKIN